MKLIVKFIVTGLLCLSFVEKVFGDEIGDGIVAIEFQLRYNNAYVKEDSQNFQDSYFDAPFRFYGATGDYSIESNLLLLGDLFRLRESFLHQFSFLEKGGVYQYSYGSWQNLYAFDDYGRVKLQFGFRLGHQALAMALWESESYRIEHGYDLYVAPVVNVKWFVNRFALLQWQHDATLSLWRKNFNSMWSFHSQLELLFDPLGSIPQPSSATAFFTLGLNYQYSGLTLESNAKSYSLHGLSPYLRVSILF